MIGTSKRTLLAGIVAIAACGSAAQASNGGTPHTHRHAASHEVRPSPAPGDLAPLRDPALVPGRPSVPAVALLPAAPARLAAVLSPPVPALDTPPPLEPPPAWQPPAYVPADPGTVEGVDARAFWWRLSTLDDDAASRDFFKAWRDQPAGIAWRKRADGLAETSPSLKARLTRLDDGTSPVTVQPETVDTTHATAVTTGLAESAVLDNRDWSIVPGWPALMAVTAAMASVVTVGLFRRSKRT